jgi:dihydroorotate dehydrogenase electron transfer subunit
VSISAPRAAPPFSRRLLAVAGMDELGPYRVLRVADVAGPVPRPGQFAMLAAAERWGGGRDGRPFLPRALSIARFRAGEAHFLLEDAGPGSQRLCELRAEEPVWMLGPLGQGFSLPPSSGRRPILVGGGVGIAPLAILQDSLECEAPTSAPLVLLGFRDRPHVAGAGLLRDARLATEDGSAGDGGLVSELLLAELDRDRHAMVYACGPSAMLEAVRAVCAERAVPAELALEAPMACGFGACYGCVVAKRGGGYARLCVDGPVLDASLLERVGPYAGAAA